MVVEVNRGTRDVGRGKRGIEIDLKEFMALRNLVHYYCPNPFRNMESKILKDQGDGDETKRISLNESIKKVNQSYFSPNSLVE